MDEVVLVAAWMTAVASAEIQRYTISASFCHEGHSLK
jgi:hypothetical protein